MISGPDIRYEPRTVSARVDVIPVLGDSNGPIRPTPALLIAAANALIALQADELSGNPGQFVSHMLRELEQPVSAPWSAAFIHHVGYWSHFRTAGEQHGSSWPLPAVASCEELAAYAQEKGVLLAGRPVAGDVSLLWSPAAKAFLRAGVVVDVLDNHADGARLGDGEYRCDVIEGAASDTGMHGSIVMVVRRTFSAAEGDRFVRWAWLDDRDETGMPVMSRESEAERDALLHIEGDAEQGTETALATGKSSIAEFRPEVRSAEGRNHQWKFANIPPAFGDAALAVDEWLERERTFIQRVARAVSYHRRSIAEDLEQEGMIELWEVDPTRFDIENKEHVRYLRRMIVNRMKNRFRTLWRQAGGHQRVFAMDREAL